VTRFGAKSTIGVARRGTISVRIFRSGEVLKGWTVFAVAALKVSRAFGAVVPYARALRLLILELGLAVRAKALGLGIAWPAYEPDIAHGSVAAQMASDGEVIHDTDSG
jgi:hypothetical protein